VDAVGISEWFTDLPLRSGFPDTLPGPATAIAARRDPSPAREISEDYKGEPYDNRISFGRTICQ